MDRDIVVKLNNGKKITVMYQVKWEKELYGDDSDGKRGVYKEGVARMNQIEVFDQYGTGVNQDSLSIDDKIDIYSAIKDDLEKIDKDDFDQREYDSDEHMDEDN